MLTFDEFRAVNKREKAREENIVKPGGDKQKAGPKKRVRTSVEAETPSEGKVKDEKVVKKSFITVAIDSIGEFLELHQMQTLYVLLIVVDTFVSLAEMYLSCPNNFLNEDEMSSSAINRKVAVRLLKSFSTFTTFFFAAEIITVIFVFGRSMFTHWGYILDILTTSLQIYLEQKNYGKISRLLNILRFWRMARLMTSMVNTEKDAHDKTVLLLEKSENKVNKLTIEMNNLSIEMKHEKEARDSIEDMLQNYKDEVDTLNEALKIAAMDIAEVAQTEDDFNISDDDQESQENDDDLSHFHSKDEDNDFVDAATSKYSRNVNKSTVMRAVMEDGNNSLHSRGSSITATSAHNYGASTFLVHEDGTFEQK